MANRIPEVPGFSFCPVNGHYELIANPAITIEVVQHGRLAPEGAWSACFNGDSTRDDIWGQLAQFAAAVLAARAEMAVWPTDWSVPAPRA